MGKIIVESNYRRFEPVGQEDMCANCPSSCKTTCARVLMQNHDTNMEKDFDGFKVTFEKRILRFK